MSVKLPEEPPDPPHIRILELSAKTLESVFVIIWMLFSFFYILFAFWHKCFLNYLISDWKLMVFVGAPFIYHPLRRLVDHIIGIPGISTTSSDQNDEGIKSNDNLQQPTTPYENGEK